MSAPRILVTGTGGQVGGELARLLVPHGQVLACDRAALDLADADAIVAVMRRERPGLVINAGAYTAVDLAERERDAAFAVNARAPQVLAEEAKRAGALLVHYSTDYVFDGRATAPYPEDAPTGPLNVYGASKLAGEQAIAATGAHALVLRTSWVYGLTGKNFLRTIQRLAAERDELRIVADQAGAPNWSRVLAEATVRLVALGLPALRERAGLYHLSSQGATTWHGFAQAIVGAGGKPRVTPIATTEYPTPARRPAYGVLATQRFEAAFGFALPAWDAALDRCLAEDRAARGR
ncbi:MAG: dTDP-4-dehydrorhamnose reductase [Burkholderiales bacterium]